MITYGFSTRKDGDMREYQQREQLLLKNNLNPQFLVIAQQTHGTNVAFVQVKDQGTKIQDVDGLLATESSMILGIRTADCVPVIFFDRKTQTIAAAHSGWKGTYNNIVAKVVQQMVQHGSNCSDISVVIGPHIQECCYDIPQTRVELFRKLYGDTCLRLQESMCFLSLQDILFKQLTSVGISKNHIHNESVCTSCAVDTYYSYRKETRESFGEQLGFIAISG